MTSTTDKGAEMSDLSQLYAEIERYLAAVDLFRREGCALRWQAEARR